MTIEFAIVWAVFVAIGCLVGAGKGQLISGLVWSFLLGPLGVLIVLAMPNRLREGERLQQTGEEHRRTQLLEQTLKAQEEQIRLLREMVSMQGQARNPAKSATESPAEEQVTNVPKSSKPPMPVPPKAQPDFEEFVPESLRPIQRPRTSRPIAAPPPLDSDEQRPP